MLNEGHTVQTSCFRRTSMSTRLTSKHPSQPDLGTKFAKLMFPGKYGAASALLTNKSSWGATCTSVNEKDILPSVETVSEVLESKHPHAQSLIQETLPTSDATVPPLSNPVLFDCTDADSICCASKTHQVWMPTTA